MAEKKELDEFHWHELLDRTHVIKETVYKHIGEHPACKTTKILKPKYEQLVDALESFYQAVGELVGIDEKEWYDNGQ